MRSMRYTDIKGRAQRLTSEQAVYLGTASVRQYDRGWGGLRSTLTVRLLRERGLIEFQERHPGWRVSSIRPLGETVLAQWNARKAQEREARA